MFFAFFGGVFAFFGGDVAFLGVISRFWGYFRAMRPLFRAQREIFFELIFRNGAEQNGGLPPCCSGNRAEFDRDREIACLRAPPRAYQ